MISPQSPRSDPGATGGGYSPVSDDRFMYKNRRKEQKRRPVFNRSGGPSILVYVKDSPKKTMNKQMQQQPIPFHAASFGTLPTVGNLFDPLQQQQQAILNSGLMFVPTGASLPSCYPPPPTVASQRQRYNSTPNLGYTPIISGPTPNPTALSPLFSMPTSGNSFIPGSSALPQFTTTKNTQLPFLPPSTASFLTNNTTFPSNYNTPTTFVPQTFVPPAPMVTSCAPSGLPFSAAGATASMSNHATTFIPPQTQVKIDQDGKYPTAGANQDHSETPKSTRQYQPVPAGVMQPAAPAQTYVYPQQYPAYKCMCDLCSYPPQYPSLNDSQQNSDTYYNHEDQSAHQQSPSEKSVSSDSGYCDSEKVTSTSSLSSQKDKNPVVSESGERLMVFVDQNNPTFSLDSSSLQQVMEMARRENIDRYEPVFQDEKRQIRKRIPCRNLIQHGICHFGENCWFSHDIAGVSPSM